MKDFDTYFEYLKRKGPYGRSWKEEADYWAMKLQKEGRCGDEDED